MSTQPTTGEHEHGHPADTSPATTGSDAGAATASAAASAAAAAALEATAAAVKAAEGTVPSDAEELEGIKMVALESAELATRSANLAVGAAENMKTATTNIQTMMTVHKKQFLILLSVAAGFMFVSAAVFTGMTISLKSRINQMDSMLSVLNKRVAELDDSLELVSSVNEGLQAMVAKQDDISKMQGSLENRLNEAIKNAESVPEKTAQQVGEKGQVLATQMKSLEARFSQQSRALESLAGKVNGLQGAVGETGGFKKEMEALARLQRERQAAENAAVSAAAAKAAAAVNNANSAAAEQAKQKEKMVQYPRAQQESTPAGSSGVLSSKP
jgi:DNA repair exonuclease SbcCD ATPase subunit